MDFIKGKNRLSLYLFLLAVLAVGVLAAIWSVTGTGAYLTGEGDWQTLAGDYRIGTIDYTVRVDDELLLGRNPTGEVVDSYRLAVPILGGVKMFDPDLTGKPDVLAKEFNEGATIMKVRVTNYSKNMVDVTTQFSFRDQTVKEGVAPIRVLALPATLTEATAATFDCRSYILNTLGNPVAGDFAASYLAYMNRTGGAMTLEMGILPGSTGSKPAGVGDDKVLQDGTSWCYYKDVFLVVWTEYESGEFNTAVEGSTGKPRQGQFTASFTVGQLD